MEIEINIFNIFETTSKFALSVRSVTYTFSPGFFSYLSSHLPLHNRRFCFGEAM